MAPHFGCMKPHPMTIWCKVTKTGLTSGLHHMQSVGAGRTVKSQSHHPLEMTLVTISRRSAAIILGIIWFIDGLLQLKPQMFTQAFLNQVILPMAQGQPSWISDAITWGVHFTAPHIGIWNLIFALTQLMLGIAFILNVIPRTIICVSIVWSLVVWVFGEGVGQLFTGQSLIVSGAPGAVIIYAFIALAIWPRRDGSNGWSGWTKRFSQASLGVIWVVGCIMLLQPSTLSGDALSQAVGVSWLSTLLGHAQIAFTIALAIVELILGVLLFFGKQVRTAAWVSIGLSFVFWWVGQSFGQVFDPLSTDVNSGPLLILLAICALQPRWTANLTSTQKASAS